MIRLEGIGIALERCGQGAVRRRAHRALAAPFCLRNRCICRRRAAGDAGCRPGQSRRRQRDDGADARPSTGEEAEARPAAAAPEAEGRAAGAATTSAATAGYTASATAARPSASASASTAGGRGYATATAAARGAGQAGSGEGQEGEETAEARRSRGAPFDSRMAPGEGPANRTRRYRGDARRSRWSRRELGLEWDHDSDRGAAVGISALDCDGARAAGGTSAVTLRRAGRASPRRPSHRGHYRCGLPAVRVPDRVDVLSRCA